MALQRAVAAPKDREVARALAEKVRIREEKTFWMLLGEAQPLEDLLVGQAFGLVSEIRAGVERGAELGESPAFDEAHFGLRDVAAR